MGDIHVSPGLRFHTSATKGTGSIPGWELRPHMPGAAAKNKFKDVLNNELIFLSNIFVVDYLENGGEKRKQRSSLIPLLRDSYS